VSDRKTPQQERDVPRSKGVPRNTPLQNVRIYCLGPGFGESIVVRLPCGGWGVVDCYHGTRGGTVDFLEKMKVERLKFFCLTHPHEDHYRGANRLFDRYTGNIEQVWRFPWQTAKDLRNLALAANFRDTYHGDSEGQDMASNYLKMVESFIRERDRIADPDRNYRHVMGYNKLIEEDGYQVEVRGPVATTVEKFQERFAQIVIKTAPELLSDEGGELINSISVVLMITFGAARIFLLGDAQGPTAKLDDEKEIYTLVKIAHHGSNNGLGAETLTTASKRGRIDHGLLTPYNRSSLPSPVMRSKYKRASVRLIQTREATSRRPRQHVPTMGNPHVLNDGVHWVGVEVSNNGATWQFQ